MKNSKYCGNKQCGAINNNKAKFCLKCGYAFIENDSKNVNDDSTLNSTRIWKKPWLISGISLFSLILALYISGLFVFDKNAVITAAEEAATQSDVALLFEQITVPDGINYSEDLYKDYLMSNDLNYLASEVESTVRALAEDETSEPYILDANGNRILKVLEQKKFGVYSLYSLQAIGYDLSLQTNMKNTEVEIIDKKMTIDKGQYTKLGAFLPSDYEIKTLVTTNYGELENTQQIFHPSGVDESIEDIAFSTYDIYLDSTYPEAELFINGESTGKTIAQFGEVISLVPEGKKVSLSAELKVDDTTFNSETYEVTSENNIYFEFPEYEVVQAAKEFDEEEAKIFFNDYRVSYEQSVIAADFLYVIDYFKPGTETYKGYQEFVNDHSKFDSYEYIFLENEFKSFKQINEFTIAFETFESFEFTAEQETYLYDREKRYTLTFDKTSNRFLIDNIEILDTKKTKQ